MSANWTKLENKEGAAEAIRRMGEEDLLYLNKLILERLKLIHQARSTTLLAAFNVGDRVSFLDKGDLKTGTVRSLNKKTVTVDTDDGHRWKVYPGFLGRID